MMRKKKLSYKWDKRYADDRWYCVMSWIEHSNDGMAEFGVHIQNPSGDGKKDRESEAALAERIAILMNLAAGIPTAKLYRSTIESGGA